MKNVNDPRVRDQWAKSEFRITAFEMEGVGLATTANQFDKSFLLIRGISDIADGVRNDQILEPYAARVAAAFLGALFERIPTRTEVVVGNRKKVLGTEAPTASTDERFALIDLDVAPQDR